MTVRGLFREVFEANDPFSKRTFLERIAFFRFSLLELFIISFIWDVAYTHDQSPIITNIFFQENVQWGVYHLRRIYKIFSSVLVPRTTSPHTSTGKTRLYTQHFAANRMSGKIRVQASERLKVGKVGYFRQFFFFVFSHITFKLFILEENFFT